MRRIKSKFGNRFLVGLAVGATLMPMYSLASGFALIEQSASGQGLSYAGAAANPEDASMMWFNPAGLTQIQSDQLIAAGHIIKPVAQFRNDGSYISTTGEQITGADDNGAQTSFLPNVYWKTRFKGVDFGIGLNVPFGSSVDYEQNWVGRYHAVYTETQTININPAFAFKVSPYFSVGAGVNIQSIDVNLTQKVDFGVSPLVNQPQQHDGYADLQADGIGYGYNFGLLFEPFQKTYLGLSYRSEVKHDAEGSAEFMLPDSLQASLNTDPSYQTQSIRSKVTLPASASVSLSVPITANLQWLTDATWTGWSSFDELRIAFANRDDSVQDEKWTDVMRYSTGFTYQASPQWVWRTGVALDETPIPNASLRTPRIPDSERVWFSVGAGYSPLQNLRFDIGYSHLWGGEVDINAKHADTEIHYLTGSYDTKVDILSAQVVWSF